MEDVLANFSSAPEINCRVGTAHHIGFNEYMKIL
jgi:hypothetical protein